MKNSRLIRTLICLALVCCILVNQVPVRAEAAGLSYVLSQVAVPALQVLAGITIALGVRAAYENSPTFYNLVQTVKSKLTDLGIVNDDYIEVAAYTDPATGNTEYYVPEDVIKATQDEIFASGAVSVSSSLDGFTDVFLNMHCDSPFRYYCYRHTTNGNVGVVWVSSDPGARFYTYQANIDYTYYQSLKTIEINGVTYSYHYGFTTLDKLSCDPIPWNGNAANFLRALYTGELDSVANTITLAEGLEQGTVIGVNTELLDEAYKEWSSKKKYSDDNDGKKIPYWPVGYQSTFEETEQMTQEDVWSGFSDYSAEVLTNWQKLFVTISSIRAFISSILNKISTWSFDEWVDNIKSLLQSILDAILNLPSTLGEILTEVLTKIFVPSSDFLTEKFNAIKSRFDWVTPFIDIAQGLAVDLSSSEPPVIYLHLGDAESKYNYGGTVKFVDMSWYAPYKPAGDAILSGFLWSLFAWRMYLKIPGIISGASGTVGHISSSLSHRRKEYD